MVPTQIGFGTTPLTQIGFRHSTQANWFSPWHSRKLVFAMVPTQIGFRHGTHANCFWRHATHANWFLQTAKRSNFQIQIGFRKSHSLPRNHIIRCQSLIKMRVVDKLSYTHSPTIQNETKKSAKMTSIPVRNPIGKVPVRNPIGKDINTTPVPTKKSKRTQQRPFQKVEGDSKVSKSCPLYDHESF